MMNDYEIRELSTISRLLAAGLAAVPSSPPELPLEVAQALSEAKNQMSDLPEVIADLRLAFERFNTVSSALTGMMELAGRASEEKTDDEGRRRLNEEFAGLARVVAADAGRSGYQGPSLNLKSRGEALSAARITRYLSPVIETMRQELDEQKNLIQEVITETLSFLNIIIQCYPEAEGAETLNFIVEAAKPYQISSPAGTLH